MRFDISADTKAFKQALKKASAGIHKTNEATRNVAQDIARDFLAYSFPAVGNDPRSGKGGTEAAKQQGIKNLRADINGMFFPLKKFTVRELVMQRNPLVFQLGNPIKWRNEGLARAWQRQDMDTLFEAFAAIDDGLGEYDYDEGSLFRAQDQSQVKLYDRPTIGLQKQMMTEGRWNKRDRVAIKDAATIRAFIENRKKSIGKSANGWDKCLSDLGGVKKSVLPGKGLGGAYKVGKNLDAEYRLENPWGDPNGWVSKAGIYPMVYGRATASLGQKIFQIIKQLGINFKK
jgi:hypothetical protein